MTDTGVMLEIPRKLNHGVLWELRHSLEGMAVVGFSQLIMALSFLGALSLLGKVLAWTSTPKEGSRFNPGSHEMSRAPSAESPSK